MAWDMYKATKPYIYNYNKSRGYWKASPRYFTWQTGKLWSQKEEAVKYINDTKVPMRIDNVSIKTVACDSGGRGYWAAAGYRGIPCEGYGATYYAYIRVTNDGGRTFQESKKWERDVPNISGSNMNSPGTGKSNTARFGDPPYKGNKGLVLHKYTIEDCPIIEPGGVAYVHLGMKDFKGPKDKMTIRFVLNPHEMEVDFKPGVNPYVWRFCEDNEWHLVRPIYVEGSGKSWSSVEDEE